MASMTDHRSLPETILLWFLQVLGAVTAILFGAFGVLSWQVAGEANQLSKSANSQSDTANLVALVALCAQIATGDDWRTGRRRVEHLFYCIIHSRPHHTHDFDISSDLYLVVVVVVQPGFVLGGFDNGSTDCHGLGKPW
ncbi:hypothetical protein diail_5526 [Diaporthe ilicicola]|nr:hypothetical protein diail_5526 [Diaporthe ilicicola]